MALILVFVLILTISTSTADDESDDLINKTIEEIVKNEVTIVDIMENNSIYIGSTPRADFSKSQDNGKLGIYLTLFGYTPRINISGTHYIPESVDYENGLRFNYGAYPVYQSGEDQYTYARVIVDSCTMTKKEVFVDDGNVTLSVTIEAKGHTFEKRCHYYDGDCYEYLAKVLLSYTGPLVDSLEKPQQFSRYANVTMAEYQNAMEISVNGTDIGSIRMDSFGPGHVFNMTNVSGNITVSLIPDTFLLKRDNRGLYYGEAFDLPPVIRCNSTLITYLNGIFYVPRGVNVTNISVRSPAGEEKVISIERIQVTSRNSDNGWRIVIAILIVMGILNFSFKKVVRW
ncbi:MAG: hypothetical protein ABIG84_02240 [archaeon]